MVQLSDFSDGQNKIFQCYHGTFIMADEANNYAVTYAKTWLPVDPATQMTPCWPGSSIPFSTWDRDNDGHALNCAATYGAGFWFTSDNCTSCNPNGQLYPTQHTRQNIPNENFWTPTLGDWTPGFVTMILVRYP
ncbi:angiopoietin-related protein 4-like [Physella acuta]|uniref:angiopoietin-related protein 4-like n=1 Tax=Physella acuta TaxID=109671 RepID=UPI0027DB16DF|nr:angiopoietin-related protein 4-like [Physella acuta]